MRFSDFAWQSLIGEPEPHPATGSSGFELWDRSLLQKRQKAKATTGLGPQAHQEFANLATHDAGNITHAAMLPTQHAHDFLV
jgi:hypothetical protein